MNEIIQCLPYLLCYLPAITAMILLVLFGTCFIMLLTKVHIKRGMPLYWRYNNTKVYSIDDNCEVPGKHSNAEITVLQAVGVDEVKIFKVKVSDVSKATWAYPVATEHSVIVTKANE